MSHRLMGGLGNNEGKKEVRHLKKQKEMYTRIRLCGCLVGEF